MNKLKKQILSITLAVCLTATSGSVLLPNNAAIANAKTYVYIAASGNGQCYHSSKKCSNMRGRVRKLTKKSAKSQGYRACKKCYH